MTGREGAVKQLQQFIERLQRAQSLDVQQDVLSRFLEEAGFRYFTYHVVKLTGTVADGYDPPFMTNYPEEWVRRYGEQDYLHRDPVVLEGPRRQLPFRWSEVTHPKDLDSMQRRLFSEAADLGITNGLTIPIHGRGGEFAALNLIPDGTQAEQTRTLEFQFHLGHLAAFYWHSLAGARMLERHGQGTGGAPSPPALSRRECEVLTWVARGKSTWDVAQILGLAERTVIFHVENAKRKLDAATRTHLVVKAVMSGLITP